MAEIHIEKKKSNLWLWILGVVLIALLIWAIAAMTSRNRNREVVDHTAATSALQPAGVVLVVDAARTLAA